ncbi:hypothetical protein BGZ81_009947 [Podila clonocystis]|nr:hypothetical protein BGZ81_009947 [Podila clonocystis]
MFGEQDAENRQIVDAITLRLRRSPGYELKRVRRNSDATKQKNFGTSTTCDDEEDEEPLIRRIPSRHVVQPSYSTESDDDVMTPANANLLSKTGTSHGFRADEMNEICTSIQQAVHVPRPATPISESEAGADIQWPVLLAETELRSPEEIDTYPDQLRAKIKELIGRGLKEGTALSYAPHLVRWQSYCDESCHGNYTVEAEKLLSFLRAKLFRGKPILVEVKDKSNILIGLTEHNPLTHPTEAYAEAKLIRSRFEAGT